MRRASLIFNPRAGKQRKLVVLIPQLITSLAQHGIAASAVETTGAATAGALASAAVTAGSEIVFACGGDGTVHEVLQGLVLTPAVMGIVPIGTANALARNLGISLDPVEAVVQQANLDSVRLPVGQVTHFKRSMSEPATRRFFAVMAGAGPDGVLVYSLLRQRKSIMGRYAYYAHAARLFVTKSFRPFCVSYRLSGSDVWQKVLAISVMSARIEDLGGVFGKLTRGSSLQATSLRLILVRPPGRIGLASWFALGQLGMDRFNPFLIAINVEEYRCEPIVDESAIHAQVDGEWIGCLPIAVALVADALSVLAPRLRHSNPAP